MTRWGFVLFGVFLALGLSSLDERRALRYAVSAVIVVLLFVSVRNGFL